ncbi:uncharacterized protein LTHEOB_4405 [Neofusicoccum parvum]|nr:uncharacterized protein LTHEOB_4405 [Neofusicoccum parvum]
MRPLYSHLVHILPPLFSILLDPRPASAQDGHVPRCYYPDGTLASNDYACRLNTTESFCCTTNVTCLDNKICQVLAPTQYEYNRGTCTDKTWTSDECPKFCQAQSPSYGSGVISKKEEEEVGEPASDGGAGRV